MRVKTFRSTIAKLILFLVCCGFFMPSISLQAKEKANVLAQTVVDDDDEFKPVNQSNSAEEDEFKPAEKSPEFQQSAVKATTADKESKNDGALKSSEPSASDCAGCPNASGCLDKETNETATTVVEDQEANKKMNYLYWIFGVLGFTAIAGILVRYKSTRKLRGLFLLASLFVLGFYKQGCTACPVDGIQNTVLFFILPTTTWHYLVWIVGIIIITYLFGKVWCGWVCHWGALQELLHHPGHLRILQGEKTLKVLRVIRYILFIALIAQLIIMAEKYWCRIDPFVQIFTFGTFMDMVIKSETYDIELLVIITLVVILLITSVISYRPFCRTACPIGLILGWISYLPGASVIGKNNHCSSCKRCANACKQDAIIHKHKANVVRNSECIACGDCMDACHKKSMTFFRKSSTHTSTTICNYE